MLQREAQIQYNVSNNQTTGIMDTVSRLLCLELHSVAAAMTGELKAVAHSSRQHTCAAPCSSISFKGLAAAHVVALRDS
jgi:hypothetical protein